MKCASWRATRGVRPWPPPTRIRNPVSPPRFLTSRTPISWNPVAARSSAPAEMAILNLRGRKANSGCSVDHCRMISAQTRGSSISSCAAPASGSQVTLRIQFPDVWMACMSKAASRSRISGASTSLIQLNWMFWRVVKCPKPRSKSRAMPASPRSWSLDSTP